MARVRKSRFPTNDNRSSGAVKNVRVQRSHTTTKEEKEKRERERKSNLRSFSVTKAEKLRYIEKEEIHLTRIVKVESTRP